MTHFNGLTPAESERLSMLAEEAAEIVQSVTKILRHGYESHHPETPTRSNRNDLENEVCDFLAVLEMFHDAEDLQIDGVQIAQSIKAKRRYTHHQEDPVT
tara:strand:+ start:177 stop:476 length:300 start_codon:yes stop_codon:yes gene_type:complete